MTPSAVELAAEGAALEILELEDRVRDLEGQRDIYREMVQEALAALRTLTVERDRLRQLNAGLREELRENGQAERLAA